MIKIKYLPILQYEETFIKMQKFTNERENNTLDEIWFLQHFPIFTQGQKGKSENIIQKTYIPIFQSNRGGQITYHGPGQLVVYLLIDLKRRNMNIRQLIGAIEDSIIYLLKKNNITAINKKTAPGVYVKDSKIASLGLKIIRGCSMHGFALNIEMDLTPFQFIHPCGYQNLKMINLKELNKQITFEKIQYDLEKILIQNLDKFKVNT